MLRGPQGTLYGRNTIAGAIKLVPRRPTNDYEFRGEVTFGSYERFDAKGTVSGPIIKDKLLFSVSALTANREGFATDFRTGEQYNDKETYGGRGALLYTPTEQFEWLIEADFIRERPSIVVGRQETVLTNFFNVPLVPAPSGAFDFDGQTVSVPNQNDLDNWGVASTVTWSPTDAITLKSVTAHRNLTTDAFIDIDATRFRIGDVFVGVDQDQTSQEFQFTYDDGGKLKGVFGLFYLNEDLSSDQTAFAQDLLSVPALGGFLREIEDAQELNSYAAYGQATYQITSQLSATAGLRYTYENKEYFRTTTTFFGAVRNGSTAAVPNPFAFTGEANFDNISPRVGVEYALSDEVLVYGSVARGFKSGGFNGRANRPGEEDAFDDETVWTYELGLKGDYLNNRLRANTAVFWNDYNDFQARVGGAELGDFPVINAAELRARGWELELTALPLDGITLTGTVGYLDADYREFFDPSTRPGVGVVGDRSDETPPFSPKWNARVAGSYTAQLGSIGSMTFGLDAAYRSTTFLSVDQFPPNPAIRGDVPNPLIQDPFWLWNAQIRFDSASEYWSIIGGVKNLTDRIYRTDAQEFSTVGNIKTAYYGDPRTFNITLAVRF